MNHGLNRAHLLAVLLCVVPCAAIAANLSPVQKEIATAKIHATVAAHAESLKMAQLHLHHVINCMVGEHGSGYSAAAEALAAVPCTGLGKGAIADSSGDPPQCTASWKAHCVPRKLVPRRIHCHASKKTPPGYLRSSTRPNRRSQSQVFKECSGDFSDNLMPPG